MLNPAKIATRPDDAGDHRPAVQRRDRRRRLLAEPAAGDRLALERLVERRDRRPEREQLVRLDVAVAAPPEPVELVARRAPRPDRADEPRCASWRARVTGSGSAGCVSIPTCFFSPSRCDSWRNASSPRLARSRRAVVRARRDDPPARTKTAPAGVSASGGPAMWIDGSSR